MDPDTSFFRAAKLFKLSSRESHILESDDSPEKVEVVKRCAETIESLDSSSFIGFIDFYDGQRDWPVKDLTTYSYLDHHQKSEFSQKAKLYAQSLKQQLTSWLTSATAVSQAVDYYLNKKQNGYKPEGEESRFNLATTKIFDISDDLEGRISTGRSGASMSGNKPAQTYIKTTYKKLIEQTNSYVLFITCNTVYDEVNMGSSWDQAILRRDQVIDLLAKSYPQLIGVLSCIEEFTGKKSPNKSKAKASEDPTEESDEESEIDSECKVYSVPSEGKRGEVLYFFSEFDEKGQKTKASSKTDIIQRIIRFILDIKDIKASPDHVKAFTALLSLPDLNRDTLTNEHYCFVYDVLAKKYGLYSEQASKKDTKKTQKGYAHMHLSAFFKTVEGHKLSITEITRLIQKAKIFKDIDTQDFIDKSKSPLALKTPIGYCLKNSRHRTPFIRLGFINPCKLHNTSHNPTFNKYFYDLLQVPGASVLIDGVVDISTPTPETKAYKPALSPKFIGRTTDTINHLTEQNIIKNNVDRVIDFVNRYLRENDLAISGDGFIYQKIKASRYTFDKYCIETKSKIKSYCTIDLLLAKMSSTPEGREIFSKQSNEYIYKKYANSPAQEVFDKIFIDFQWIEFKDFFVHIPTKKILTCLDQIKYPAFTFIPNLTLEDYNKIKTLDKEAKFPVNWLYILQNSGYVDSTYLPIPEFAQITIPPPIDSLNVKPKVYTSLVNGQMLINDLYKLLAPHTHKSKRPVLLGRASSGKTTLIAPFQKLLPLEKIGTCSASNGFEMSNFRDKLLMILDETSLKSIGLNRSTFLQTLEGGALMNVNSKGKDPTSEVITANMVMMSNNAQWAMVHPDSVQQLTERQIPQLDIFVDEAYAERCNFYQFTPLIKKKEGVKEIIERKERGLVFLYLLAFSDYRDVEIIDDMDEMDEIIDNFDYKVDLIISDEEDAFEPQYY
jgi:hypothetical protein